MLKDYVLFEAIQRELAADNVTQRVLGDYAIYKYSIPCFKEGRWNKWNRLARGLIFHLPTQSLVARPMPKFFNLDEQPESRLEALPSTPGIVFEKVDGSCIIVYLHDGEVACATPGSMDSPQAQWALDELARRGLTTDASFIELLRHTTPVMEAIFPENKKMSDLVVFYGDRQDLVLLAVLDHDGHDWAPNRVDMLATLFGFSRPSAYDITVGRDMPEFSNAEGYVIQWHTTAATTRVKFKFEDYKRLQKIVAMLRPGVLVELMMAGSYRTLAETLPAHIREQADDIAAKLRQKFYELRAQVDEAHAQIKDLPTRKEQALNLLSGRWPGHVASLVFLKLDGKLGDLQIWNVVNDKLLKEM